MMDYKKVELRDALSQTSQNSINVFGKILGCNYQLAAFVGSERESRLLYFSLINILAIVVVAIASDIDDSASSARASSYAGGTLMLQFLIFICILFYFSPKECVRSSSPIYVCICLCISEYLIGGNSLGYSTAFAVRGVSYIAVGTIAVIESTDYIEWTIFRLVGAVSIEVGSWVLLVVLHSNYDTNNKTLLIHHSVVSVMISIPIWMIMYLQVQRRCHEFLPPELRSSIFKTVADFAVPRTNQVDTNPDEPERIVYNIDSNASLIRTTPQFSDEFEEDTSSPAYRARLSSQREAYKYLLCQKIMSLLMCLLHITVMILVVLGTTKVMSSDTEDIIYSVCVNSVIGLWQVKEVLSIYL